MSVGLPCQPFGPLIQCTCDNRGTAVRCLPVMDLSARYKGVSENNDDIKDIMEEKRDGYNLDQSTEIILAFTLLIIIILSFIL